MALTAASKLAANNTCNPLAGQVALPIFYCSMIASKAISCQPRLKLVLVKLANVWMGCRMAALFVVERLKSEVVAAAIAHFQALALHKTRRRSLRRLANKYDKKCPKDRVCAFSQQ